MYQTTTVSPSNSTDASFRAWGSAINAQLAAAGFVQTADTGQINWATVTHPTTVSTFQGYEVWRFSDTAQTTAPIFFRLQYGSGATAVAPAITLTVGSGSDGAGNLTGSGVSQAAAANQITATLSPGSLNTSGTAVSMVSDSAGFALLLWPSVAAATSTGTVFALERFRNWDGTAATDGHAAGYANAPATGGAAGSWTMVNYLTNAPIRTAGGGFQPLGNLATSGIVNGVIYPLPLLTGAGLKVYAPSKFVMAAYPNDLPYGTVTAFTHYGTSCNWMHLGYGSANGNWGAISGNANSLYFRVS